MPHPFFSYAALAMSQVPMLIGINAIFDPEGVMGSAKIHVPTEPTSLNASRAHMRFFGARNIAVSTLMILIWSTGDEKLLGQSLFVTMGLCAVDGLISRFHLGGGAANHWFFIPVLGSLAAGLLSYYG